MKMKMGSRSPSTSVIVSGSASPRPCAAVALRSPRPRARPGPGRRRRRGWRRPSRMRPAPAVARRIVVRHGMLLLLLLLLCRIGVVVAAAAQRCPGLPSRGTCAWPPARVWRLSLPSRPGSGTGSVLRGVGCRFTLRAGYEVSGVTSSLHCL
ncbi:hypothetical protein GGR56DRAFT_648519 [Xylariaceae sp. FL0804]|nr:hypothetical protein GGR56DRAFT_648519 [Xylariaceae sp. FL0804]